MGLGSRIRITGLTVEFDEGEYSGTPFQQAKRLLKELSALEGAVGLEIVIKQEIIPGQVSIFDEDEPVETAKPQQWVIRSDAPRPKSRIKYWNKEHGWTTLKHATVFTEAEMAQDLAIPGEWRWRQLKTPVEVTT